MIRRCLFLCMVVGMTVVYPLMARSPHSGLKPLKNNLIVLTFDDAAVSHYRVAAPLLKKYGFGGTFYVCEFPGFENKEHYMSWEQIRELNDMGFEIGNHSRNHGAMSNMTPEQIESETSFIEQRCAQYGIPRPETYAYPGYDNSPEGIALLRERGYRAARHGGDTPYVKGVSDAMLMPSYSITDAMFSDLAKIEAVLAEACDGQVVVFCLHGTPDLAHDFVSTSAEHFEQFLKMLKRRHCRVISMRDLLEYDL